MLTIEGEALTKQDDIDVSDTPRKVGLLPLRQIADKSSCAFGSSEPFGQKQEGRQHNGAFSAAFLR